MVFSTDIEFPPFVFSQEYDNRIINYFKKIDERTEFFTKKFKKDFAEISDNINKLEHWCDRLKIDEIQIRKEFEENRKEINLLKQNILNSQNIDSCNNIMEEIKKLNTKSQIKLFIKCPPELELDKKRTEEQNDFENINEAQKEKIKQVVNKIFEEKFKIAKEKFIELEKIRQEQEDIRKQEESKILQKIKIQEEKSIELEKLNQEITEIVPKQQEEGKILHEKINIENEKPIELEKLNQEIN